MLDITISEAYDNDHYTEFSASKSKKKEKQFIVNKISLKKAQRKIEKLRPIRDHLADKLKKIKGFSGIVLGNKKMCILVHDEDAHKRVRKAIEIKYLRYINIRGIMPLAPEYNKPVFGKAQGSRQKT